MIERYIDHTVLAASASQEQVKKLCEEADKYGFASVCVNPCHVALCAELLSRSKAMVCTVVGFPLGASASAVKAFETKYAVSQGADEIDMVINIGALKEGRDDFVREDIAAVVEAADGKAVKVILETCLLTDEEKERACRLSLEGGAAFVKTSTGFSTGGASVEDIALMRRIVGDKMGVKASGGIRDYATAMAMVNAGANRIGASAGIAIVEAEGK